MKNSTLKLPAMIVLYLLISSISGQAQAHFLLNLNVRIFHIEHTASGANLYMRVPMPYLLADKTGLGRDPYTGKLSQPAPYTKNSLNQGDLVHYVDFQQLELAPLGLGNIAESATFLRNTDKQIKGDVKAVRLYRIGNEPDFATLEEAQQAFLQQYLPEDTNQRLYVGDTLVDIQIFYPLEAPLGEYQLSSSLNPGLPNQEDTANLVLDYNPGKTQVFRSRGLMQEPLLITHSTIDAMKTFLAEGIAHILKGLDHVLFVLCLSLGALSLPLLLWRATGFTIGHSITLSAGFFGFVPTVSWFVPMVETGIALSIIYMAWISLHREDTKITGSESTIFIGTCMLGLLHGLGFSFVLHEILQVDSPNIWQSLLAFNLGIEAGQVLIILAIWPLAYLARLWRKEWEIRIRYSVAGLCSAIAFIWTLDRGYELVSAIF
ncbi:HupE/UreJ family protein [Microbulbifer sp. VAAF005]|uniref:HupE/UreJ family protein n=1 Tax=Microbulbifer sp. VAAF005 TaxID=3034230 RepID=UPI0024AC9605|nr:HupE/UreJ family protein [Microbulbifer sp. VAAF005]WHI46269.1 HupE/UreJ family protein [Microbulbifer sp. VAAF005]